MTELVELPGDPVALKAKADALATAAEQIQKAINQLRTLADRDETVSLAVDKVRGKASDVADNITKAHVRYAGTAKALQEYAPKLESAQGRAKRAIAAHNSAVQTAGTAQTHLQNQTNQYKQDQANAPKNPSGDDAPTSFAETPAGRRASQAVDDANQAVTDAIKEYNEAKAEVDAAAQTAISAIKTAIDDSGLNDGFWDKLGHWASDALHTVADVLQKYVAPILDVIQRVAAAIVDIGTWVSMVLNVLAVFIPVLAPLAAAVDIIVLAAAAISFLTTAALVVLGDRSLGDLLNTGITLVVSALPFKAGAGSLGKGLSKASEEIGSRGASKLTAKFGAGLERATSNKLGGALETLSKPLDALASKVGERGAALAEKSGVHVLDHFGEKTGMDFARRALDGSLEHGATMDQALANAAKQYEHGVATGVADTVNQFGQQATNALSGTVVTSVTNNVTALADNLYQGSSLPGSDYFVTHSNVDIPTLVPNVQVIHSDSSPRSSWGAFDVHNDVGAYKAMFHDVPEAWHNAKSGTAVLG